MANQNVSLIISAVDRATSTIQGITGNLDTLRAKFGNLAGALGVGGSVAWLANLTKQSIEALDDLDELAQGLGIAADKLSAYQLSARAAGVDQEQFTGGINKLNKYVAEAAGGNKEAAAMFRAMGVEIKDATGKLRPLEEILGEVSDRFSTYADGSQKSALAMELFGKTGAKFIAFLNQGKEGLDQFGGASKEEIENAKKLAGEIDKLSASWDKLKLSVGGTVAGWINGKEADPPYVQLQKTNVEIAKLEAQIRAMGEAEGVDQLNDALLIMLERARSINETLSAEGMKRFLAGGYAAKFGDRPVVNPAEVAARVAADEKAAAAARALAEQREKAQATAAREISALEIATSGTEKLTAAQSLMLKIGDQIAAGQIRWTQAETAANFARLEAAHAAERKAEADKAELARNVQAAGEYVKKHDAAQQIVDDLNAEVEALKLTGIEREIAIELYKLEKTGVDQTTQAYQDYADAVRKAVTDRETLKASQEAARDAEKEWKRTAEQIEQSLTDALVQGFEGGKSFMRSVGDYIVNFFRTYVARGIAQALMGAIGVGLSSAASAFGGGGATGGGLGNLGSLVSMLGSGGNFAGGVMGTLGGIFGEAGVGGTLSAGWTALKAGNIAGGLGSLAPYAAAAYGLYRLISGVGTGRQRGPAYQEFSALTGAGNRFDPYAAIINNPAGGNRGGGTYDAILQSLIGTVGATAGMFGGSANSGLGYGLFTSTSPDGLGAQAVGNVFGAGGQLLFSRNTNGGNEDVAQRLAAALPGMILVGLQQSQLPKRISEYFNSVSADTVTQETLDTLIQTASAAHQMAEAFKDLGGPFADLTNLSVEARTALAGLTGGMDAFAAKVQGYYSAFYSQEEQQALSLVQAQKILQGAGIDTSGLTGRDAFRSAVEGLNINTPEGQRQFAAYMNAAGAFASGSDLLGLSGMSLRDFTAGAPGLAEGVEVMASAQDQTNTLLANINTAITAGNAAIVAALGAQRIEVSVRTSEPSSVEVGLAGQGA